MSDGLKLLGAIIDSGGISTLRDLDREMFIEEELRVFDFMRSHYRRYGEIPTIQTVEADLGVVMPEALEVIDYYIKKVHDRKLYQAVREKFNELKECLRDYDMDAARGVIDQLRASTRIAHTVSDIRTAREAGEDVMRDYENANANPGVSGVPTGWLLFDIRTGGYQPGDLVTWVARPGMGKTYILLKQAIAAWKAGYSVLVVTMEMTIEQMMRRIASIEAGLNPDYVRKGTLSRYAKARLEGFVDNMVGADRLRLFSGGMKKKVSDVELLVQEFKPDIVLIDGVYLMQAESKRQMQKTEKVSDVFDELKQMTLACNIPVVVTTQLNRMAGKKGKDSSLETIAYTDAISTHSSLVISLREGEAPHQTDQRIASFLKGREGEDGDFHINYRFAPIDFSEIIEERDEETGEPVGRHGPVGPTNVDWMVN